MIFCIEIQLNESDASDDGPIESTPDLDDILHLFSALLKHPGNLNVPVVDVRYDLSEVETIRDPSHFLRERWELYQYVPSLTS